MRGADTLTTKAAAALAAMEARKSAEGDTRQVAGLLAGLARQAGQDAADAGKRLLVRGLTARLDPADPFDQQLLGALSRWELGDHA